MWVIGIRLCLVEHAEHPLQPVVNLTVKKRYLNNNAVMHKTVNKRVGNALGNHVAIIVVRIMVDIDHRLLNLTDAVSEKVNGNHRNGIARMTVLVDITFVTVLSTKVLAETQGLRLQPCLLQLH